MARLVRDHPELFAGRVFLMDRNFLGYHLITAILDAGGHLIMRVRAGISLPVTEDGWLPDGSRLTYLDEPGYHRVADRLPLRVASTTWSCPAQTGRCPKRTRSRPPCLITARLTPRRCGPHTRCAGQLQKPRSGEQNNRDRGRTATTPCLRSGEPDLIYQEFWAWLAASPADRASAAAATGTTAAAAINARRHPAQAGTDQVSFTTMRRAATTSMRQSLVTATTSLAALAALAGAASQTALHALNVTGRQRYSERKPDIPAGFRPHCGHQTHAHRPGEDHPVPVRRRCHLAADQQQQRPGRRNGPAQRDRGRWNRASARASSGRRHARDPPQPSSNQT